MLCRLSLWLSVPDQIPWLHRRKKLVNALAYLMRRYAKKDWSPLLGLELQQIRFFRHSITSDNLLELASSVGPRFLSRGVIHFFLLFILSVFATNAIALGNPSGDEIVFPLICYFFVLLCSRYHATGFSSVSLVRYLALLATMRCSSAVAAKRLRPRLMHYRQEPCGLATSILRLSFPNIMPFWVRPKNLANLCVVCPDYYIVCICSIISSDRQPVSH